jgi:hypothetical protein
MTPSLILSKMNPFQMILQPSEMAPSTYLLSPWRPNQVMLFQLIEIMSENRMAWSIQGGIKTTASPPLKRP